MGANFYCVLGREARPGRLIVGKGAMEPAAFLCGRLL